MFDDVYFAQYKNKKVVLLCELVLEETYRGEQDETLSFKLKTIEYSLGKLNSLLKELLSVEAIVTLVSCVGAEDTDASKKILDILGTYIGIEANVFVDSEIQTSVITKHMVEDQRLLYIQDLHSYQYDDKTQNHIKEIIEYAEAENVIVFSPFKLGCAPESLIKLLNHCIISEI